jgi:membrane protease YdiL (CAAX protease family)
MVLALLFAAMPVSIVQVLVKSLGAPPYDTVFFVLLAVPIAFLAYWGYVRLIEHRIATEIAFLGAPKELGLGVLLGLGLFTTTIGLLWGFGFYQVTGTNGWSILIASLSLSVMSGFVEELLIRGIIFRIMEESLGTWIALSLSALLFGFLHLGNPNASLTSAIAIALEAGLLLGACYVLTRRLWLAIGVHFAWNFAQGGIFGVAVSGNASKGLLQSYLVGPEVLSGGAFGAEASVFAVAVCVTGFLFIINKARHQGQLLKPFWMRKEERATTG